MPLIKGVKQNQSVVYVCAYLRVALFFSFSFVLIYLFIPKTFKVVNAFFQPVSQWCLLTELLLHSVSIQPIRTGRVWLFLCHIKHCHKAEMNSKWRDRGSQPKGEGCISQALLQRTGLRVCWGSKKGKWSKTGLVQHTLFTQPSWKMAHREVPGMRVHFLFPSVCACWCKMYISSLNTLPVEAKKNKRTVLHSRWTKENTFTFTHGLKWCNMES